MIKNKPKQKTDFYVLIPLIVGIVVAGTITNYNILYTTIAGIGGALLGILLKKLFKK
jgi:uncharacterized membrane protein YeaQ/YmgE (transglycosylase-associated protein family)